MKKMATTLTKDEEELDAILRQEGEVRGVVLLTDAEYVLRNHGGEALRRVEEVAKKMGCPIGYDKIKAMHWYPIGFRGVSLVAIREALNLDAGKLREMGSKAPKYSLITKLMLRYLVNLNMLVSRLQSYWNKNYSVGVLTGKLNNRTLFICVKDCLIPKSLFPYLEGYFVAVIGMIIGNQKQPRMEDNRWMHRNGTCLEFVIRW